MSPILLFNFFCIIPQQRAFYLQKPPYLTYLYMEVAKKILSAFINLGVDFQTKFTNLFTN
jgi:hypothetical protein